MEHEFYNMSWSEFEKLSMKILNEIHEKNINVDTVVPVIRGGAPLGTVLGNSINGVDTACIHVRRSQSDEINAKLGEPVLKGITNVEAIRGKDILIADDMLDKGVTMKFVLQELRKFSPKSIHIAVLYNFTDIPDEEKEMYIIGGSMEVKKWIVFPWEKHMN